MRVIAKPRLREFWAKHPDAESPLKAWWKLVRSKETDWKNIQEVKATLPGVDGFDLKCGVPVVVFNIGGNKYRLVARIEYAIHTVYIKHILTHDDYDKGAWKEQICRESMQQMT